LRNTDERVADDKPVTPTFLYSLLLYGPIAAAIEKLPPQRWHEPQAILEACDDALREAQQRVSIPRRVSLGVRDMYAMQPRLEGARGKRALRLLENPRFRAAYDLLMLRAGQHMAPPGIAEWWEALQAAPPAEREQLAASPPHAARVPLAEGDDAAPASGTGRRRRRRRRRRGGGAAAPG
jgi:poly(A) polymerase